MTMERIRVMAVFNQVREETIPIESFQHLDRERFELAVVCTEQSDRPAPIAQDIRVFLGGSTRPPNGCPYCGVYPLSDRISFTYTISPQDRGLSPSRAGWADRSGLLPFISISGECRGAARHS